MAEVYTNSMFGEYRLRSEHSRAQPYVDHSYFPTTMYA